MVAVNMVKTHKSLLLLELVINAFPLYSLVLPHVTANALFNCRKDANHTAKLATLVITKFMRPCISHECKENTKKQAPKRIVREKPASRKVFKVSSVGTA